MRRILAFLMTTLLIPMCFVGCNKESTELSPDNPVVLTMWHVYGEQADSPMNKLVEEFNRTVGKDKGYDFSMPMADANEAMRIIAAKLRHGFK